jgi:hypothetical protein
VLKSLGPSRGLSVHRWPTEMEIIDKLILIALITLVAALAAGFYFTYRKAKKTNINFGTKQVRDF